jgi:transcription elongation GreA/GreB family factor
VCSLGAAWAQLGISRAPGAHLERSFGAHVDPEPQVSSDPASSTQPTLWKSSRRPIALIAKRRGVVHDPDRTRYLPRVSKAFLKEDDASAVVPPSTAQVRLPDGPFRLTATGARALASRDEPDMRAALARAEILPPRGPHPERAALGVTVRVRTSTEEERTYRVVSPEERALLGEGVSVEAPLGRALLGARVGDVRELRAPKGTEELEVVALEGEE